MKKYLRLFLCLLLGVLIIFSTSACKEEAENIDEEINDVHQQLEDIAEENKDAKVGDYVIPSEDDFYWEDVEGGVAVVNYYGAEPAIAIPDTLGGKNVVEITSGVFDEYDPKGVELPETLITIGEETFYYCMELVEVKFGNNVKEIGQGAFEGCVALSAVELPDSLEVIGQRAFANCGLIENIDLPTNLKDIGGTSGSQQTTRTYEPVAPKETRTADDTGSIQSKRGPFTYKELIREYNLSSEEIRKFFTKGNIKTIIILE